jgi:hypothetical protein
MDGAERAGCVGSELPLRRVANAGRPRLDRWVEREWRPGVATPNLDIEIFEPWYHDEPDRPYITAAPSLANPGETIYVESTYADEIDASCSSAAAPALIPSTPTSG